MQKSDIRRWTRGKGIRCVTRYSTPKKFANLVLAQLEKRLRATPMRAMPYRSAIDVTNACNLKCTYCPTGNRNYGRKVQMMSLETVEQFLDELGEYMYLVDLFNWGDPLLHPKIGEIVSMVHKRGIFTRISSSLSTKDKGQLQAICDSGLDHLLLSIDGASQEVYEQYRVGGNLDQVLKNIATIVEYKKKNNLDFPVLEWRFLRFDHNRHEVKAARALAEQIGVDFFTEEDGIVTDEVEKRKDAEVYQLGLKQKTCGMLYKFVLLSPDGGVAPCCNMIDKRDDFGDFRKGEFAALWNNEIYTQARKLFKPEAISGLPSNMNHPCLHCPIAQAQPHLREYLSQNVWVDISNGVSMPGGEMAVRTVNPYANSSTDSLSAKQDKASVVEK